MLAVLDPAAAAPLFGESTGLRHENAYAVSYEANLVRNLWARWQELMARIRRQRAASHARGAPDGLSRTRSW